MLKHIILGCLLITSMANAGTMNCSKDYLDLCHCKKDEHAKCKYVTKTVGFCDCHKKEVKKPHTIQF